MDMCLLAYLNNGDDEIFSKPKYFICYYYIEGRTEISVYEANAQIRLALMFLFRIHLGLSFF